MKKTSFTFLLILTSCLIVFAGGPYKIRRMLPNKKIMIGQNLCGKGDIFDETQVIHWDPNLSDQAFEADDISNPSRTIGVSKSRVRKETSKDISYKELCSLQGKGYSDYKMLWPEDSIQIYVGTDTSWVYKLHIEGTYVYKELKLRDSLIYIKPELFDTLSGCVEFDIVRIKGYDINVIKHEIIELIK